MSVTFKSIAVENSVITPVALALNEAKPASISLQKWQVVVTGVGIVDFQGNNEHDWRRDTLFIFANIINGPLDFVISRFGIPIPSQEAQRGLELDQSASFAAVSSSFSRETGTVDAGFAVDHWETQFNSGFDLVTNTLVHRVFNGLGVSIAVRNNKATLHRISFHINLVGRIAFLGPF